MNATSGDPTCYRITEAAALIGVSDDTLRRWIKTKRLPASADETGHRVVAGTDLAALAVEIAHAPQDPGARSTSARNRAVGLVTAVKKDAVMAQVDLQCGPFRFVSLMSREAVDDLDLKVGDRAIAVVKATTVVVEI